MKKILVLFGGCSPEYGVSLQSAYSVLRHMDRERYRPIPVGITQAGDWFLYTGKWEAIPAGTWQDYARSIFYMHENIILQGL